MRQLGPAATLPKVTQWVEEFVLRTVQRTVHISLPHSEEWRWVAIDDYANSSNYDVGLIRSFQWITPVRDDRTLDYDWAGPSPNYNLPGIALDRTEPSIIVFVQAPWVLSQRDFKNFVHTKSVSLFIVYEFTILFTIFAATSNAPHVRRERKTLGKGTTSDIIFLL